MKHMASMTQDFSSASYDAAMSWKRSSLELLVQPDQIHTRRKFAYPQGPKGKLLQYKVVTEMEVLGSLIDRKGSLHAAVSCTSLIKG